MRSPLLSVTLCAFFTSQALAFVGTSLTRAAFQRQAGSGSSCDTACDGFDDAVQACNDQICLCTATNARSLQQCITCYMTYSPTPATTTAAQHLIDTFDDACDGYSLPQVTLPSTSDPTADPVNPTSGTTRGTSPPVTSAGPVINPDPTPVQQTNTANFPANTPGNNPNGPRLNGDASPRFLVSGTALALYLTTFGVALAL